MAAVAEPPSPIAPEVVGARGAAAKQSLDERLAAVTAAGGLTTLPLDFGDADGDWATVRSDNPFTVLYLDSRQAHLVTPEMVATHRDLLQRFWREKLRSMSQGAARFAILKKYGGVDESERLVRSYPELIERAYQQLATRGAIGATCSRLAAETEAAACSRVDEKLDDFLVDSVLQPDEVRALFEFGDREGVRRTTVAERIHQRLRSKGFVARAEPAGSTLEAQLLSTVWMHPARVEPRISVVVAPPPKKSLLVPLFLFSFVVVIGLLVATALRTSSVTGSSALSRVAPSTSSSHLDSSVLTVATGTVSSPPQPPSQVVTREPLPESPVAATPQQEARPAAVAVSAEERRRVAAELVAIRQFVDSDPEAGLERMTALERSLDAELVETRLEAAQLRSELEKALLRQQLAAEADRQQQEAEERARVERDREWEQRLAGVEELMKQPNYSGAKMLADQLLATPGIPPPVAERVGQLREQALAELQRIFSGAKVKSKTGRSPRGQR